MTPSTLTKKDELMRPSIPPLHLLLLVAAAGCATEVVGYRPARDADADRAVADVPATPVDVGADVATVTDIGAPEVDVPPPSPCVSGVHWTRGDDGSALMNPGQACIECHARMRSDGPQLVGGTAYGDDGQEDNCNGFAGNTAAAYVTATDAAGVTFRMTVNQAGNFYYTGRTALRFPLRGVAVVSPSGRRNEMDGDAPNGDCNGCHTVTGTSTVAGFDPAPGRILVLP